MPKPKPSSESRSEWMERCIPVLVNEGREQDQAVAICNSMWEEAKKGDRPFNGLFEGVIFKRNKYE
jgi:hypothetical protein